MADRLFFTTQAGDADSFLTHASPNGSNLVSQVQDTTGGSRWQETVIDAANNRYFILEAGNPSNGVLYTGQLDSTAAPTVVHTFSTEDQITGLEIDTVNHRLYINRIDWNEPPPGQTTFNVASTGILQIDYNPSTGTVSNTSNFLVTQATANLGDGFIYATDFARDDTDGTLYFVQGAITTNMIYRVDPSTHALNTLLSQSQFPTNFSNGLIADVDVDAGRNLVYFSTFAQPFGAGPTNRLWVISDTATGSTNATAVTLNTMPGGATFIPGDFTIDQATHQLYVESEENPGSGNSDDLIYRFQLSTDGLTATFLNVIDPPLTTSDANIGGLEFVGNTAAALDLDGNNSAGIAGSGYQATFTENGSAVAIADTDVTIADDDANVASATITLTNHQTGDLLSVNGGLPGGIIASAYNSGTGVLTLTGSTTLANYQAALQLIVFSNSSDAPSTIDRSITITVNDGTVNSNTATATIHITAVDDPGVAEDDDDYTVVENGVLNGTSVFLDHGNGPDSDPDPAPTLTEVNGSSGNLATQITLASGALLTVNLDGTFTYNPNGQFDSVPAAGSGASNLSATETFTYTLAGGDTATVTITITGIDSDDVAQGTSAAEVINVGIGADSADGGGGADTMFGAQGDDSIDGGLGADSIYGGIAAGSDPTDGADVLHGGGDGDFVQGHGGSDQVFGDAGADTVGGGKGSDTVLGGADNDVMAGGNGSDSIYGGSSTGADLALEADTMSGGEDGDFMDGQGGNDEMRGDAGQDTANGGGENDTIFGGGGNDSLSGGDGNDSVYGGSATADTLIEADTLSGGDGTDFVQGNGGNDQVNGDAGSDSAGGGGGNDSVNGGADGDQVAGGAGTDTLTGGTGDDTLTGGADNDSFVFLDGDGVDRVNDFADNGVEKFDLSGLVTGDQNFGQLDITDTAGPGVTVDYGTGSFLIANINVTSQIDAGDFLF